MFTAALRGLALLALADIATGDISSVDVFVHGEHPLCPCLRIPSIAATNRSLYAFAECREWLGDGCDPLGVHSGSGPVRIAMKHSANGGVQWSPLTILTVGCQPTAVYDESTDTLLFMFKNDTHSTANLMTTKGDDPTGWTSPRVVIDPRTQEKHHRPLFPGPGNAVVLSSTHPTHPHRILFPVWLGPDGATTSASLYYTDDGGATFKQTETTWPHDGNDESTIVELTNGDVLYITRSNSSPCSAQDTSSRCLELQRSTDGGQSFAQIGAGTANPGLAGPPCDISAVSVSAINHTINHNYWSYDWKPCKRDGNHWAELPTPGLSSFEIYEKEPAGRSSWVNISVQASPANTCSEKTWPCFLEGSAAGPKSACDGAPDYAGAANIKAACGFHGTETCFGLLPLGAVTRAMRYGDIVLFHDGAKYSMDTKRRELSYLDPQTGRFSKSLGAAFSLRPGKHPPPYRPPPPPSPAERPARTLYLSHSENLAMTSRTNGTVRASVDNGITWPYTLQATIDTAPQDGNVFSRQAFGYSCLSAMPKHSQYTGGYLALLWESSTPDCTAKDASCAVKFSVVPQLCEAGGGEGACNAWTRRD